MSTNNGAYNNLHIVSTVGECTNGNIGVIVTTAGEPVTVNDLRSVCGFLLPPAIIGVTTGVSCPYDKIVQMMNDISLNDDGIKLNQKIKSIETDFCNIVRDENMLCESMEYINDKALENREAAQKFAILFASHTFDALAMNETKVRSAMLKILETNFLNANTYRLEDKNRLYNSITLLGEYYNRVRLATNSPIRILGESLLDLLISEISDLEEIDVKLARLILSQITLNGDILRSKHKEELAELFYHIRRNLIEQTALRPVVKAYLLMTLDLYYNNFSSLDEQLEQMYTKYLLVSNDNPGSTNNINNNMYTTVPQQQQMPQAYQSQPQQQQQPQHQYSAQNNDAVYDAEPQNNYENGTYLNKSNEANAIESNTDTTPSPRNESYEIQPSTKKWSEQVCEDSLCENELNSDLKFSGASGNTQDQCNSSSQHGSEQNDKVESSVTRNARRAYKPRNSPRPLKQNYHTYNDNDSNYHQKEIPQPVQQSGSEECDETKPLPRWRAPRFNRSDEQQDGRQRNRFRRFSGSYDDDKNSVRSEGGSIRLYSVNDRLKHSQEKMERSSANYNNIANSNWDRQSQHDDRSERSYASNYERGNNYRRGSGRHYNSHQGYDKPPRFQKNQKDQRIRSDSWRSSTSHYESNLSHRSNGPESNSRSSSRARTLPRPAKSNMDAVSSSKNYNNRRSQSPTQHNQQYQQRNCNPRRGRSNYNKRYSSQSSLTSDVSTDRRHHQRNRNFQRRAHQEQDWNDTRSEQGQQRMSEHSPWDNDDKDNSELVRNARQTTKFMNYLSSQK